MKHASQPIVTDRKYIVPAVERAILIMQLLQQEPEGLTISQISQRLAFPKSTTFTILNTLRQYGMARLEESGRYRLGMELFVLGSTVVESLNLRSAARPILKRLAQATGLTAHLGIIDRDEVVYIEKIESPAPIRISSRVGGRMGVHSTALGKVMLAYMPEAELCLTLDGHPLPARTPNTITGREQLMAELERIRAQGHAVDYEENELGIRCLAGPVYNHQGEAVCAVSVSGPADQLSAAVIEDLAGEVLAAVQELSRELGYLPQPALNAVK